MPLMNVTSRHYADALVVTIEGRLDHETSKDFQNEYAILMQRSGREIRGVVLDLAGLEYISSSGLKALMQLARESRMQHQRIWAAGLRPLISEIFSTAHLGLMIQIFPTLREAIEAVSTNAIAAAEAASPPAPDTSARPAEPKRVEVFQWFKYDAALNSSGPHSPRGTREAIASMGALPYQETSMWVDAEAVDREGFYREDRKG